MIAGLGFDYVRGRERSGDQENLTFIPPFRTSAELMYDDGSFDAGLMVKVVSKQAKVASNEAPKMDNFSSVRMAATDLGRV